MMISKRSAKAAALAVALCMLATGCGADGSNVKRKREKTTTTTTTAAAPVQPDDPVDVSRDIDQQDTADEPDETDTSEAAEQTDAKPQYSDKYDPVIVNEGVEAAVAAGKTETANITGNYWFTFSGFDKTYSNEELNKAFDHLQEIISNADCPFSFSYQNAETGAYIAYRPYDRYWTCSTIKAPFVKSLLAQDVDLDQIVVRNDVWPGDDGELAYAPYGTEYTVRTLMEKAIKQSDNTAYLLLTKTFGVYQFNLMLQDLGANYYLSGGYIFTQCSSDDMLKCYLDIYRFGEENGKGAWLVELLTDTDLNIQIGKALGNKYKVAQKYGTDHETVSFNDCAIVYADSPFVLTVFTTQVPETEHSCIIFKELAVALDDINCLIKTEKQ
ncbi:MAG: serine hydrolase [Ruminococcus sp.]|nr:serine hydrolase [Ruminococcus sp.]